MHSIESAVITYTIIITCFSQVSSLTLARGQALTAGVTRGLTMRLLVRQSDTTEAHAMNIIVSVPQVPTPSRSFLLAITASRTVGFPPGQVQIKHDLR